MRRTLILLASLLATPAFAADIPTRPLLKAAPVVTSYSPFYIGLFAGGGWSQVENELTIAGTPMGPIKVFPTGLVVGGEVGARWNLNPIVVGINASAGYNFSKASVGCDVTGGGCLGYRKDGVLLQEGGEVGINLGTLFGYIPSGAQPANWPVPITVPASIMGNLTTTLRGGVAERDLTLCATQLNMDETLSSVCGSKWIIGPYVGGKISAALSQQIEAYVRVDHIFWNSSFTPVADPRAAALFTNATRATGETLAVAGVAFHF
jgi:hypothetical protein